MRYDNLDHAHLQYMKKVHIYMQYMKNVMEEVAFLFFFSSSGILGYIEASDGKAVWPFVCGYVDFSSCLVLY